MKKLKITLTPYLGNNSSLIFHQIEKKVNKLIKENNSLKKEIEQLKKVRP